jgi:hypothetical protein
MRSNTPSRKCSKLSVTPRHATLIDNREAPKHLRDGQEGVECVPAPRHARTALECDQRAEWNMDERECVASPGERRAKANGRAGARSRERGCARSERDVKFPHGEHSTDNSKMLGLQRENAAHRTEAAAARGHEKVLVAELSYLKGPESLREEVQGHRLSSPHIHSEIQSEARGGSDSLGRGRVYQFPVRRPYSSPWLLGFTRATSDASEDEYGEKLGKGLAHRRRASAGAFITMWRKSSAVRTISCDSNTISCGGITVMCDSNTAFAKHRRDSISRGTKRTVQAEHELTLGSGSGSATSRSELISCWGRVRWVPLRRSLLEREIVRSQVQAPHVAHKNCWREDRSSSGKGSRVLVWTS